MPGCYVTRRDLLRWTAVALAASPAIAASPAAAAPILQGPRRRSASGTATTAQNLELVTLTEDRAILTWYTGATGSVDDLGRLEPAPADAEISWGTSPTKLDQTASSDRTDTPYHRVELAGLEPGRTYYYQARSGGQLATPSPFTLTEGNAVSTEPGGATGEGPFAFTTPQPPPGTFLFSVVLCNDMHIGETVAGRSGDIPGLEGVSQVAGHPPYPEVMFESLVDDASGLGALFLLAAGDITAEAEPIDLTTARTILDRFGDRHADWWVTRGNHDRAHDGEAYAACRIGAWGGHDCFVDQFFPEKEPTYFVDDLLGMRVIGLDTYDKAGKGSDPGSMSPDQVEWFRETIAQDRDQPTMVFGHHPLLVEGSPYPSSAGSMLDPTQAAMLVEQYRDHPGVFLHHAGHTHRNKQSTLAGTPGVVHQEVAAVKEYPGGFTLMRVHSGGYALNFHKSSSDEARAWSERSRLQVGGTWPQFSFGSRVADRNVVVARDLSGVRAPEPAPAPTATAPASDDDGPSPVVVAGAGLTVLAAGAGGLLAWRRRGEEASSS